MIIGIGHDLVDIRRIEDMLETHGERFLKRCFSEDEVVLAEARRERGQYASTLAKRYAAKEACLKALGCGHADGVYLKDVEVALDAAGAPFLILAGGALTRLPDNARLHVSLTDEPPYASAYVIIQAC
jgi:holo-[acyl-carrier protein] synthase